MSDIEAKRKQVADQCRVISHMAKALAEVHDQLSPLYKGGHADPLLDAAGNRTARLMETLGDILNGMDANDETDDWAIPIYQAGRVMFPQARDGSAPGSFGVTPRSERLKDGEP